MNDKSYILKDVLPNASSADVKRKLSTEHNINIPMTLKFKDRQMKDNVPLSDYQVQNGSIITALPHNLIGVQKNETNETYEALKKYLSNTINNMKEDTFIFVSIGCYDPGHLNDSTNSVIKQQCPKEIYDYCQQNNINLYIILVDEGFKDPKTKEKQIYDINNIWQRDKKISKGNEIVFYQNSQKPEKIFLSTFATNIEEWSNEKIAYRKVAGTPICDLFVRAVKSKKYKNCCLAAGTFYVDNLCSKQPGNCLLAGSSDLFTKCGIVKGNYYVERHVINPDKYQP